jgi:hypothetical protein
MGRKGMHTGFWWESQKESNDWEDLDMWEDNIKIDLRETGWGDTDWINMAQDRD